MKNGFVWISVMVCLVLVGCGDRAAPKLKECNDARSKGDTTAAIAACEEAASVDPRSVSGRTAHALAEEMKKEAMAKAEALRREREAMGKRGNEGKPKDAKPCNCNPKDPLCEC